MDTCIGIGRIRIQGYYIFPKKTPIRCPFCYCYTPNFVMFADPSLEWRLPPSLASCELHIFLWGTISLLVDVLFFPLQSTLFILWLAAIALHTPPQKVPSCLPQLSSLESTTLPILLSWVCFATHDDPCVMLFLPFSC